MQFSSAAPVHNTDVASVYNLVSAFSGGQSSFHGFLDCVVYDLIISSRFRFLNAY